MINKLLFVAGSDQSQGAAFEIMTEMRSSGYSSDIARSPEDESRMKADKVLVGDMSLDDYKGVVVLDDGGDAKAAAQVAKAAFDKEIMVAGYASGCLVLAKAGILKDKYVCKGLPKGAYKGAKGMVNSVTVRSDNIVTCRGNCPGAFSMLMLDVLGGEVRKVVKSHVDDEPLNSDEAEILVANKGAVADLVEPICGRIAAKTTHSCPMVRTAEGWKPATRGVPEEAVRLAEMACVAIQSGLQNPGGLNSLNVGVGMGQGAPQLSELAAPPRAAIVQNSGDKKRQKDMMLERELAHEGIWMQPDGRLAIQGPSGTRMMTKQEAAEALKAEVFAALEAQMNVRAGDLDENKRAAEVSTRAKHRLKLVGQMKGKGKTAAVKTAAGYLDNLDLKMPERVWEWKDGDDTLEDRDEAVRDLPRYNPEYDENKQHDGDFGFYYVWDEPANAPYQFDGPNGSDSPYKTRDVLQKV